MKTRYRIEFLPALWAALAFFPKGFAKAWLVLLAWPVATLSVLAATDGATAQAHAMGAIFLFLVLAASRLMAVGALFRAGLGKEKEIGFGGLQWRAAEWRIIGAGILVALLAGLIYFLVNIVIVVVVGIFGVHVTDVSKVASALRDWRLIEATLALPNAAVLIGMVLIQLLTLLLLAARLALWLPGTVAQSRLVVTDSFALTQNSTISMVLGIILTQAPIRIWKLVSSYTVLDPAVISRWIHLDLDEARLNLAVGLVIEGVLTPLLSAGFLCAAYRQATKPSNLVMDPAPETSGSPAAPAVA